MSGSTHTGRRGVTCVGEAMVVLTPEGQVPVEESQSLHRAVGGAEANAARMVAALGVPARFVSRVGADPFGRVVLAALHTAGVDDSAVQADPERGTGLYVKAPSAAGSTLYYYRSESAATTMDGPFFALAAVDRALATAVVVHTSGITAGVLTDPDALVQALIRHRDRGALLSVDLNWRPALWRGRGDQPMRDLLGVADLVFVGADEARAALGSDKAPALRRLVRPGATIVVKSDAHAAAALLPDGRTVVEPALTVDVVEPVGAGDAFAGGYLAGLVSGLTVAGRLRLGHLCAATVLVSSQDHAIPPGHADRARLLASSAERWATIRVSGPLDDAGPRVESVPRTSLEVDR